MAHLQLPETDIMIALDRAVLIGRMVEDIGGQQGIPGTVRQVLPLLDFVLPFGQVNLLILRKGKGEEKGQTEQQAYDSLFHHSSGMLPLWQARTTSSGQRLAWTSPTWALRRK